MCRRQALLPFAIHPGLLPSLFESLLRRAQASCHAPPRSSPSSRPSVSAVTAVPGRSLLRRSSATWPLSPTGAERVSHVGHVGGDGSGVILVLVLFVLARVFRKGTEMREELEGTV